MENYEAKLPKSTTITAPHHGWDNGANNLNSDFINNVNPEFVLSLGGWEHNPANTSSPANILNSTSAMQTYCEENGIPNYCNFLNENMRIDMFDDEMVFVKPCAKYLRYGKIGWSQVTGFAAAQEYITVSNLKVYKKDKTCRVTGFLSNTSNESIAAATQLVTGLPAPLFKNYFVCVSGTASTDKKPVAVAIGTSGTMALDAVNGWDEGTYLIFDSEYPIV